MDQRTHNVYMLPKMSDDIRLMCQNLANGMRFKPCVDLEELNPSGSWAVRSADVRKGVSGASHIAATFCPNALKDVRAESFYKTFLWEIENSDTMKSTDIWYNKVLVDRAEGPETSIFRDRIPNLYSSEGRGATVQFRDDQTLITTGGVYDILSGEKLSSEDSIFRPSSELQIEMTAFSKTRIARVQHDNRLEILDALGRTILTHDTVPCPYPKELFISAFSKSGRHILLGNKDEQSRLVYICFELATRRSIRLCVPEAQRVQLAQFTQVEDKVVAGLASGGVGKIAVWLLGQAKESEHEEAKICLHIQGF